jgi:hypothetical protein
MNKTYIIIIVIFIILLLCISSSVGAYFYVKNQNDKIRKENDAIDQYNMDYNINYDTQNKKLITDDDLQNMESTECIVLTYPVFKETIVNGEKYKLSYAKISYNIKDYYKDDKVTKLGADPGGFDGEKPGRPSIYLKKELKENVGSLIPVETYIITKEPLEKTSYFKIYYDPDGRVAPPYVLSSYTNTIPKKKLLFESLTSKI